MEVQFTPETEKKLEDLAVQSGRGTAAELVQDVVEGYFDELAQTRRMLDSRYDDLKSGRVKPIDGEEAFARLKAKTEAERKRPA
ncbi:MAG: hypothetical protein ACLQOO_05965 [Terriglobia bacterium]